VSKFILCPSCEGRGGSSAYLGAFTSDDIDQMDDEFMDDYFAGNFDRKCDECQGQRVVSVCKHEGCPYPVAFVMSYFSGRQTFDHCFDHSAEAREADDDERLSAGERAFGC